MSASSSPCSSSSSSFPLCSRARLPRLRGRFLFLKKKEDTNTINVTCSATLDASEEDVFSEREREGGEKRRGTEIEEEEEDISDVSEISPKRIQKKIERAQTLGECLDLVDMYSTFLDGIHVASLYNKVADFVSGERRRRRRGVELEGEGEEEEEERRREESLAHLGELVKLRLPWMNSRSLSVVANACGKLMQKQKQKRMSEEILGHIRHRVNAQLAGFTSRDLENIFWAHGKLRVRLSVEEMDAWLDRLSLGADQMSAKSLVNLLYTCQRLRYRPQPGVMAVLAGCIAENHVSSMGLMSLINVLSSFAHLQKDASAEIVDCINLVTSSITARLEHHSTSSGSGSTATLNLRNVANVIWSFAELQYYPPERVLHLLDRSAAPLIEKEGNPLVLNTYLRACHRLARKPSLDVLEGALAVTEKSFLSMHKSFRRREEGGGGGGLRETSRLIKSLIMLSYEVPQDYLSSLEKGLCEAGFDAVSLHDSLWSFATSGHKVGDDFRTKAVRFFERNAEEIRIGPLCRIFWSMTLLDVSLEDPEVMDRIVALYWQEGRKTSHSVGLLLWAMRTQGFDVDEEMLRRAKDHARRNWDLMTPTEILYMIDVLSSCEGLLEDEAWLQSALTRARTFVIR